ncbi:hypothetical protein CEXT_231401 [Caerostris extrusa]|uniref:Uncharacterized protein n=1 Tax=Caerostris extrusa TaxID=172846 RepID=A0AAV4WH57_CAEEX|nr:hypothetical protein CEXT_231401 [Caerostris extrusa]
MLLGERLGIQFCSPFISFRVGFCAREEITHPTSGRERARCTSSSGGACSREAAVNTALTSVAVFILMGRSFISAATYSKG